MSDTANSKINSLTPWKPGQSGNPSGRPKTAAFSAYVRKWLEAKGKGDKTNQRLIVEKLAKTKPEILLYYAHGKPVESVELTGGDGEPLFNQLIHAAQSLARRDTDTGV